MADELPVRRRGLLQLIEQLVIPPGVLRPAPPCAGDRTLRGTHPSPLAVNRVNLEGTPRQPCEAGR